MRFAWTISTVAVASIATVSHAQEREQTPPTDEEIVVTAQQQRPQVTSEGSLGALGDRSALETPFNVRNYTAQLILDQQAETLGEVLENDPSVRITQGFGNQSELFVIRGFPLAGDDVALDGLYGITPRQLVSPELYERVQVLNGSSALPACTDLTSKPWVVEAGVTVIDAPFAAHSNVATAGGCLAAPYLAAWMIARGGSLDLAREALHYVAPVGEKDQFVNQALSVISGVS